MPRCTKSDQVHGMGCTREGPHRGRCRVRPNARATYASGGDTPSPGSTAPARVRKGGLLSEAQGIDAEVTGLIADLAALDDTICSRRDALAKRFGELRKALVKSRREVLRLKNEWAGDGPAKVRAGSDPNEDLDADEEELA